MQEYIENQYVKTEREIEVLIAKRRWRKIEQLLSAVESFSWRRPDTHGQFIPGASSIVDKHDFIMLLSPLADQTLQI